MVPEQSAMAVVIARLRAGLAVARDEEGAQLVEYLMLISLVAIVAMGSVSQVGGIVRSFYQVAAAMW